MSITYDGTKIITTQYAIVIGDYLMYSGAN